MMVDNLVDLKVGMLAVVTADLKVAATVDVRVVQKAVEKVAQSVYMMVDWLVAV